MKVIKQGKLRLITCPYCESVLQYNLYTDVQITDKEVFSIVMFSRPKNYCYIKCPVCNQEIDVTDEGYDAISAYKNN